MRYLAVVALLGACLVPVACSSGPAPARPGTPGFYWAAAKTNYHLGDYLKVHDNLNSLLRHENEFTLKAQPWALVLGSGLVHGLMELSDAYEEGGKENPSHPVGFHRHSSQCRSVANSAALSSIDVFKSFVIQHKEPQIELVFEYPSGSPLEPPQLSKVANGGLPSDEDADVLFREMLHRGVIYALAHVAGVPDDPARVQEMFKGTAVQVPREKFLFGMAEIFTEHATLYDRKHIDDARRSSLFYNQASEVLKGLPQDKPVKDLLDKIKRMQKTLPPMAT